MYVRPGTCKSSFIVADIYFSKKHSVAERLKRKGTKMSLMLIRLCQEFLKVCFLIREKVSFSSLNRQVED